MLKQLRNGWFIAKCLAGDNFGKETAVYPARQRAVLHGNPGRTRNQLACANDLYIVGVGGQRTDDAEVDAWAGAHVERVVRRDKNDGVAGGAAADGCR